MISVVLATYNRSAKLTQLLETLFNQDKIKDFEIIVVDNGSTDNTKDTLTSLSKTNPLLKPIFHKLGNIGPGPARNLGVLRAKGEIIAFTDDDCLVPKDWLYQIQEAFNIHPQVSCVGGFLQASENLLSSNIFAQYEKFNESQYRISKLEYFSNKLNELPFQTNNIAYRIKDFLSLGGFDESFGLTYGEDSDLKERGLKKGFQFLYIPVKVIHNQDYTFPRFWRQSIAKGISIMEYRKRHHFHIPGLLELFLRFLTVPLFTCLVLIKKPLVPGLALVETIAQVGRNIGKIKYLK